VQSYVSLFRKIFDHFPEPVLYISEQNVEYANLSSKKIFPSLGNGSAVPPEIADAMAIPLGGITSCVVAGELYSVVPYDLENSRLMVLRHVQRYHTSFPFQLRLQITNLFGAAQLLGEKAIDFGSEGRLPELAILNQGLYRLLRLTENLELTEELSEDNPMRFHSAPMDLAGLCHRMSNGIASLAAQTGSKFVYESDVFSLPTQGDSELLQIMLLNLSSNALKAVGPGGEAGMRLMRLGNSCVITIWDHGPGLDIATLTNAFDSNQQKRGMGNGMGVGLQIVRRIASLHGGTIFMESKMGIGVRTTISLPIIPTREVSVESPGMQMEAGDGFPLLLVQLSDALSYESFSPSDVN
jgi:hypothetical protein